MLTPQLVENSQNPNLFRKSVTPHNEKMHLNLLVKKYSFLDFFKSFTKQLTKPRHN